MTKKKEIELTDADYQLIANIAEKANLTHDGGDDNRIFSDEMINYNVSLMSSAQYDKLEKDLEDFTVKGPGFEVAGWNDASGYKYWKAQGEAGDFNYIQVTAYINDPSKIKDPESIRNAIDEAMDHFQKWNNMEHQTSENTSLSGMASTMKEITKPEDLFSSSNLSQFSVEEIEAEGYQLIETLFCDSSGFGSSFERAMNKEQAAKKVQSLISEHGKMYGALTGVGQFQVYVSLFKNVKKARAK